MIYNFFIKILLFFWENKYKKDAMMFIVVSILISQIVYIREFRTSLEKSKRLVDLNNLEEYDKIATEILNESWKKKIGILSTLVLQCNNTIPGSCYASYWYIENKKANKINIEAKNLLVITCDKTTYSYSCFVINDKKYSTKLVIPENFYKNIKESLISCSNSNMELLRNSKYSNIDDYAEALNVELDIVNFCVYKDKLLLLTQIKGHNAKRKGENKNVGCKVDDCFIETIETNELLKLL